MAVLGLAVQHPVTLPEQRVIPARFLQQFAKHLMAVTAVMVVMALVTAPLVAQGVAAGININVTCLVSHLLAMVGPQVLAAVLQALPGELVRHVIQMLVEAAAVLVSLILDLLGLRGAQEGLRAAVLAAKEQIMLHIPVRVVEHPAGQAALEM